MRTSQKQTPGPLTDVLRPERTRKGTAGSQKRPKSDWKFEGGQHGSPPHPGALLFAEKGNPSIKTRKMGFSICSDMPLWFYQYILLW